MAECSVINGRYLAGGCGQQAHAGLTNPENVHWRPDCLNPSGGHHPNVPGLTAAAAECRWRGQTKKITKKTFALFVSLDLI